MSKDGFAPTSQAESEVVIRLDAVDEAVHIASCWPKYSRRFTKRFGPPEKVSRSRDGGVACAWWTLPLAAFRMPSAKKQKRVLSAAQAEHARELGRKMAETRRRKPVLASEPGRSTEF